jgi:N-acetylglucosamine repressor
VPSNFVYISVSDGLGVGIVLGGELVRGQHNIAGEFGHVPLNIDGPRCGCGATGCWEAYVSNLATLSRYFGRDLRKGPVSSDIAALTVDDLIARARGADGKALAALLFTGRYLGLGLGSVINAIDPSEVYIGGEITTAWDLIEATVRAGLAERALTPSAAATPITIVPSEQYPRLRGAAALVAASSFAKGLVA